MGYLREDFECGARKKVKLRDIIGHLAVFQLSWEDPSFLSFSRAFFKREYQHVCVWYSWHLCGKMMTKKPSLTKGIPHVRPMVDHFTTILPHVRYVSTMICGLNIVVMWLYLVCVECGVHMVFPKFDRPISRHTCTTEKSSFSHVWNKILHILRVVQELPEKEKEIKPGKCFSVVVWCF